MPEKNAAAQGRAPGAAKNETKNLENPTTSGPDSQGSTADRLQRIAQALDNYLRKQRGCRR